MEVKYQNLYYSNDMFILNQNIHFFIMRFQDNFFDVEFNTLATIILKKPGFH